MKDYIDFSKEQLKNLNIQRLIWIKFSFLFLCFLAVGFVEYDHITSLKDRVLKTGVISIFAVTSVVWWYWTMYLVSKLLTFRSQEIILLEDILSDVKTIKEDVKKLSN